MKKILVLILITVTLFGCQNAAKKEEETMNTEFKNPVATINFKDLGTMTFELYVNNAPQSVFNFTALANEGYYDGLSMHRIVKNFVVQGGDPTGNGTGGPGYHIKGEFKNNKVNNETSHELGTIAFARARDYDSAGSQFYIVTTNFDASQKKYMDEDYAAFGHILTGEELLTTINNDYASQDGTPIKELIIEKITVDTKGQDLPLPEKLK